MTKAPVKPGRPRVGSCSLGRSRDCLSLTLGPPAATTHYRRTEIAGLACPRRHTPHRSHRDGIDQHGLTQKIGRRKTQNRSHLLNIVLTSIAQSIYYSWLRDPRDVCPILRAATN